MVWIFVFLVAIVSVPASAVVVTFPDPGLEAAIRDAIRKPTGDIHDTDLMGLTFLNIYGWGIVNIEGIQYCTDLTFLNLHNNQIVDISALSGLTNLTDLVLGNNQIADISALSGLTNLMGLFLHNNQIVDISALSGLINLKWLDLEDNQIVNINALVNNAGLGAEDWVDLCYNYLDLTPGSPDMLDIEALQGREIRVDFDPQKPRSDT